MTWYTGFLIWIFPLICAVQMTRFWQRVGLYIDTTWRGMCCFHFCSDRTVLIFGSDGEGNKFNHLQVGCKDCGQWEPQNWERGRCGSRPVGAVLHCITPCRQGEQDIPIHLDNSDTMVHGPGIARTEYSFSPEVTLICLSTLNKAYHFSLSMFHSLGPGRGSHSCVVWYALHLVTYLTVWGLEKGCLLARFSKLNCSTVR